MPFTPAHAVAAFPFRKTHLNIGAVAVGCLSPDFEYFLRLAAVGSFGHTIGGLFWLDLPWSLAVLMLWHRYVSSALRTLAPGLFPTARVPQFSRPLWLNLKQFLVICVSILIGATTHLIWDSFTHPIFWPYRHLQVLRETMGFGSGFSLPIYKILQHGSTLFGVCVLFVWWARWVRRKDVIGTPYLQSSAWLLLYGAVALALARVLIPLAFTSHLGSVSTMLSSFVVTCMTALWLELVWYGHKLTVVKELRLHGR